MKASTNNNINIKNKRASFDYEFIDTYTAGIVPTRMFINEKGLAKVVIALAKGKKQYDKRQTMKEKEDKRMMDRMFKR